MRWLPFLLVLSLCAALLGCQVEVYRGLTEAQVNTMLSTLLKRGIRAEKTAAGKAGFTLSVDQFRIRAFLSLESSLNTSAEIKGFSLLWLIGFIHHQSFAIVVEILKKT